MNDSFGMEIVRTIKGLRSEGLRHVLIESASFPHDTGNRTTLNVFKEAMEPYQRYGSSNQRKGLTC